MDEQANASGWADLPRELLEQILDALDPFDACGAAASCRCSASFGTSPPLAPPPPPSFPPTQPPTHPGRDHARHTLPCKRLHVGSDANQLALCVVRAWRAAVRTKDVPRLEVTLSPIDRRHAGQVAWLRCLAVVLRCIPRSLSDDSKDSF